MSQTLKSQQKSSMNSKEPTENLATSTKKILSSFLNTLNRVKDVKKKQDAMGNLISICENEKPLPQAFHDVRFEELSKSYRMLKDDINTLKVENDFFDNANQALRKEVELLSGRLERRQSNIGKFELNKFISFLKTGYRTIEDVDQFFAQCFEGANPRIKEGLILEALTPQRATLNPSKWFAPQSLSEDRDEFFKKLNAKHKGIFDDLK